MAINKKKNPAASFMSSFGAKVNKEETKKEAVVEKVVEKSAEVDAVEEKVVLPDMVSMPVDTKEYNFDKVDVSAVPGEGTEKVKKEAEPMEKVVDEAIKEDAKVKEKTVSYNFHIPYKLVKRLNRVIDEMKERDEKMLKKDFIVLAVEKLVTEYEKKYNVE